MADKKKIIQVDQNNFVYIDGIKFAQRVKTSDGDCLRICDKDRRRCSERGTRFVDVPIAALNKIPSIEPTILESQAADKPDIEWSTGKSGWDTGK